MGHGYETRIEQSETDVANADTVLAWKSVCLLQITWADNKTKLDNVTG